jgi:4-hydroxy-tetrahydrodipicolinate synthase
MHEAGLGPETVRAPRLPITGEERESVVAMIRHAITKRPSIGAK